MHLKINGYDYFTKQIAVEIMRALFTNAVEWASD